MDAIKLKELIDEHEKLGSKLLEATLHYKEAFDAHEKSRRLIHDSTKEYINPPKVATERDGTGNASTIN